jgi:hypothetical protein
MTLEMRILASSRSTTKPTAKILEMTDWIRSLDIYNNPNLLSEQITRLRDSESMMVMVRMVSGSRHWIWSGINRNRTRSMD